MNQEDQVNFVQSFLNSNYPEERYIAEPSICVHFIRVRGGCNNEISKNLFLTMNKYSFEFQYVSSIGGVVVAIFKYEGKK